MTASSHVFATYAQPDIEFVRGEGVRLYDAQGNTFMDLTSGIAVNSLGHAHPHLVDALKSQAETLWHTSNLFKVPGREKLADRLCEATFADRVFFTNSGAEALEAAIKTARRYHFAKGNPERIDIITFEGAFHGRTLATIAAGGQAKYLEGFGPKAPGFIQVPFGDHDALHAAIGETTAGILIEPVQGEGGIRSVPNQCLRGLRELCDKHGILLIYDEVQTGVGRTGKLFAHEWAGENGEAAPDIMAIAKGIGGGFPVGACLATEEAAAPMIVGTHGTTFGGNPLAMAVGNAVLDIVLEDGFLEEVRRKSLVMQQILAELVDTYPDLLEDTRGKGLLLGMKAKIPNTDIIAAFRSEGLLSVAAGDNVVRLLPPLVITEDELREARDLMVRGLEAIRNKNS
ncbi:MAG: aspartate aminotransferase family protein [Nitratireductor sp.]|nr:aspartate aminotransferase family protein [Nitratireductor sp.]MCC0022585.1 aspartate aminotransferase family protein [Nitratireductor sp.]